MNTNEETPVVVRLFAHYIGAKIGRSKIADRPEFSVPAAAQ
jgi:hypothetical protein